MRRLPCQHAIYAHDAAIPRAGPRRRGRTRVLRRAIIRPRHVATFIIRIAAAITPTLLIDTIMQPLITPNTYYMLGRAMALPLWKKRGYAPMV